MPRRADNRLTPVNNLLTHLNGRLVDEMFRRADTDSRPLVKNHHLSWYVVSWYDGTRVDVDKLCIPIGSF